MRISSLFWTFGITLLVVSLHAEDPAKQKQELIGDLVISDGQRMVQHWHDSILGKIWASPDMAPLRHKVDAELPGIKDKIGVDPLLLLTSLVNARVRVWGQLAAQPFDPSTAITIIIQADLGRQSAALFALAKSKGFGTERHVAGADEAMDSADQEVVLARFGTNLVLGSKSAVLASTAVPASSHDVECHLDLQALADIAIGNSAEPAKWVQLQDIAKRYLHHIDMTEDIVPSGFNGHCVMDTNMPWLKPMDKTWMTHIPSNAMACSALALDGKILWHELIQPVIDVVAQAQGTTGEALRAKANAQLKQLGAPVTLDQLISGVQGTMFSITTPLMPAVGLSIGVPRSASTDQVITWAMSLIKTAVPKVGESTVVGVPNIPAQISLIAQQEYWIVTSDPQLADSWNTATADAWSSTPLGKLAATRIAADTIGVSLIDMSAELRTAQGYLSMMMGMVPLEPAEKRAVMMGTNQLVAKAGLASSVMRQDAKSITVDSDGFDVTPVAVASIIAAIAIPNLLERRVASNEAAAASSLKAGVFPAEINFQAGNYHDRDKDGIGDFGFFSEMAGAKLPQIPQGLSLLPHTWNSDKPFINNYNFMVFIPDGQGGALSSDKDHDVTRAPSAVGPDAGFVAYAWPNDMSAGRRVFAITQTGVIYVAPIGTGVGKQPVWNDLFGGQGWEAKPVWQKYQRGGGNAQNQPAHHGAVPPDGAVF